MKISVIGAGNVGATVAQRIAEKELANELIMVDIVEGIPQGKALDMAEAAPAEGFDCRFIGTNGYDEVEGSDLVVITAGLPRKPGMSRDELLAANAEIVRSVTRSVSQQAPDSILIMVTNPLDVMTYLAMRVSGFEPWRVFGMAGVLDTARFRTFIAMELDVSIEDVQAMVLGGHGDTMVPIPRYTTVAGIPISELLPQGKIGELIQRTRDGGAEIVSYLKTGSAYYAPSAAVTEMVEAVVKDKKRILPCCTWLSGQYGIEGLYVGAPVKLGKNGVEEVIELKLTPEELETLHRSAEWVRVNVEKLPV